MKDKTHIKVRDLKPSKDAKGGLRSAQSHGVQSHGVQSHGVQAHGAQTHGAQLHKRQHAIHRNK